MHYLERIWAREQREKLRREQEEVASRGWAEDLRWRYVYASIKPIRVGGSFDDLALILYYEVKVEVRFDGELYTSRIRFEHGEDVGDILDLCVDGIDKLMLDNGVPPYKILTHA